MRKIYLLLVSVMFVVMANAQITVTNPGNTTPGLTATYADLATAVTALNAQTAISGPVIIAVDAANPQTAPVGGYSITATLTGASSVNTVTFNGGANTVTANAGLTAGALNDGIFKIIGSDFITIQNFTMLENAANLTTAAGTNNMTEWGVALLYASTTNGAQNITIQNNTITLNRVYQNTFGVYSNSTHTATVVTTSASATTTAGGNSNLKIYSNTISNVNQGIVVVGPTAVADMNTGIDVGGAGAGTGNTISNFGTTGTFSGYANVSGTVNGILVRNSNGFNVSYNTVSSSVGGVTAGTLNGIQIPAASATPTTTFTNTINNNSISLQSGLIAGAMNGITYPSGSASTTSTLNINSNNFHTFGHTVAGTGAITFITTASTNQFLTINNNTFTNISVNTTGSVTFISASFSAAASGTKTINNNSIVTAFNKTGAGGTVTLYSDGGSSTTGTSIQNNSNNFSNITLTGATTMAGWFNNDGTGATPIKTITGNTFNNWTCGTSAVTVFQSNFGNPISMTGNTITNITGQGAVTGINIGSSGTYAAALNLSTNTITGLSSTGTGGAVTGISFAGPAPSAGTTSISSNTLNTLSSTSTTATVAGISSSGSGVSISNHSIFALSNNGATSGVTNGIMVTAGNTVSVFKNKVYDLTTSGAFTTIPGVNGIVLSGSASASTYSVYNNLIGDLKAPASASTDAIRGLSVTATGTTSTFNLYYNTVNLGASSTGVNFGTTGIFHAASATATTATLNLRNNIIVNNSTPAGTGLVTCFRRSSAATLGNYGAPSNNNDFYTTTGSVMHDGTTAFTIATFKAAVTPRDVASFSEDPEFQSTTGSSLNFLKYKVTSPKQIESGAVNIATFTDDYIGTIRQGNGGYAGTGSAPDIGAWELEGILSDLSAPSISAITVVGNSCGFTSRNVTATITDATGVDNTASLRPRIYFQKNGGGYFSAQGSLTSGTVLSGSWTFTITYATLGGVVVGDVITYFIVAQDVAAPPNVGGSPSAGLVLTDVNTVTTPPTTPLTYTVQGTLAAGTYTVGTLGTYLTLTAAVNAYNTSCLAGAVIFELLDASYTTAPTGPGEVYPIVINNNLDASSTNTLTIRPATTVTASITGSATGALIKLNGANYVTIDGSNSGGSDRSLTIENTSVTTPSVVLIGSLGTTTVTNNTLKNCVIRNGVNTTSAVVISDATTLGSTGYFNNITIHNNDVQKAFVGVFATGGTTPQNGSNLTYTQNTVNTSGANAIRNVGLYMQGVNGATVSNNTVGNLSNVEGENDVAIWLATGTGNATVSNNTVSNLGMTLTTAFAPFGIRESSTLATSGNIIRGNSVSNISTSGSTQVFGIENGGGGTIIEKNNVQGVINNNTSTFGAYGINSSAGNNVVIRNNFVSNVTGDMTGGAAFSTTFGIFGIRVGAGTGHQVYHNSVNLYGLRTGTATTSLLTAAFGLVSTTSTGCDVRNNIFANNITGGTTSIANVSVYLPSGGTSAMNLTMNKNLYYYGTDVARQGTGQAGTTAGTNFYTTLAALAAYSSTLHVAATNDNASQAFTTAVPYVSNNDLHMLLNNCPLDNLGDPIGSVTDDYDSDVRSVTTPDIGADEFFALSGLVTTTGTQVCENLPVLSSGTVYRSGCLGIAKLTPNGGSPVSGNINTCVTIDATVQSYSGHAYLQRHFDITPAVNQSTATAKVTLYVLQSEFDTYNAGNGADADLPTLPTDLAGIANLLVIKYSGNGTVPGGYSPGVATQINPADADIVWDATNNWWTISFNVTGFSGFYIAGSFGALPVSLQNFSGYKDGSRNQLRWTTVSENNNSGFEVQRSTDGINYTALGFVNSQAVSGTSSIQLYYSFTDNNVTGSKQYYRLRQVDFDNHSKLSNIVLIKGDKPVTLTIDGLYPNPASSTVNVLIATPNKDKVTMLITDLAGRTVIQQVVSVETGSNTIPVDISRIANGTYMVKLVCGNNCEGVVGKFVKQ